VMIWLTGRSAIQRQVRLARNASRVMTTMSSVPARRPPAPASTILADLPWLQSFDRRDALVVHQLLGDLRPDYGLGVGLERALAFSAYWAARLAPSQYNTTRVDALSLREWLAQKDLSLSAGHRVASRRKSNDDSGDVEQFPEYPGQTWLDGDDADVGAFKAADAIPMKDLETFGWIAADGGESALISPCGTIRTTAPDDEDVWRMRRRVTRNVRVTRPHLSGIACLSFLWHAINMVLGAFIYSWSAGGGEDLAGRHRTRAATWTVSIVLEFGLMFEVVRADYTQFSVGLAPLPIFMHVDVRKTCAAFAGYVVLCGINIWAAYTEWMSADADFGQGAHKARLGQIVEHFSKFQYSTIQAVFYLYLVVVYCWHFRVHMTKRAAVSAKSGRPGPGTIGSRLG
jgi:hypothetical protein